MPSICSFSLPYYVYELTLISKSGQIFREIVKKNFCASHSHTQLLNTQGRGSQWVLITIYFVLVEVLVTFKFCNCFDIFIIQNKYVSVQFIHSFMSSSLWPHGLQHSRLPCPSPTPRAYSNSCPSSRWCHPTISSSVVPFSSCPQYFSASEFFPMSQFFVSSDQSIGVSASPSVLPMNIQDWLLLGWTAWISLQP